MINEIKYKDHAEWLKIRNNYIGGSDAGAVVGMNPFKSAYALWAEKTGKAPPFEENLTTEVGAYLEEFVAKMFCNETGKKVRKKNTTTVNELYPFACANIDRQIVGEKAFLEIKTTNSLPIMRQLRNLDEFPELYYCQCQHYLAVTEYEKCYLAVLVNCRELKIYEMERDEDEINALMNAEKEFWSLVKNNEPPAPDGTKSTSDTLTVLYPESNGEEIDLFGWDEDLDIIARLNAQIKELTAIKDEKVNIIKEAMKDAEKGVSDKYKISYANQSRKTFDSKRFVKEHPDYDLTEYYNTTTSRVFRITEITKKEI